MKIHPESRFAEAAVWQHKKVTLGQKGVVKKNSCHPLRGRVSGIDVLYFHRERNNFVGVGPQRVFLHLGAVCGQKPLNILAVDFFVRFYYFTLQHLRTHEKALRVGGPLIPRFWQQRWVSHSNVNTDSRHVCFEMKRLTSSGQSFFKVRRPFE